MVVIYTSDLHGNKEYYQELFELAEQKKAQAIIIGGDMLPIHGPFTYSLQEQQNFILFSSVTEHLALNNGRRA